MRKLFNVFKTEKSYATGKTFLALVQHGLTKTEVENYLNRVPSYERNRYTVRPLTNY